MISRLIQSLRYRFHLATFGIWHFRSFTPKTLRIAGRKIHLSFPLTEKAVLDFELGKILFQDCYHLCEAPKNTETILDIGANVGLFAIAARHFFPKATIHSYEPNSVLEPHLKEHCNPLGIRYYLEAVGSESGFVSLQPQENSLHTTVGKRPDGNIPQIAFRQTIDRIGGRVDFLKLDCEGAEWSIFEDPASWEKIRHLSMEYHLWASAGSTLGSLIKKLDELGFDCLRTEPSPDGSFGMLQARNRSAGF